MAMAEAEGGSAGVDIVPVIVGVSDGDFNILSAILIRVANK